MVSGVKCRVHTGPTPDGKGSRKMEDCQPSKLRRLRVKTIQCLEFALRWFIIFHALGFVLERPFATQPKAHAFKGT